MGSLGIEIRGDKRGEGCRGDKRGECSIFVLTTPRSVLWGCPPVCFWVCFWVQPAAGSHPAGDTCVATMNSKQPWTRAIFRFRPAASCVVWPASPRFEQGPAPVRLPSASIRQSPAQVLRSPAQVLRSPAQVLRSPARVLRSPAQVRQSPSQVRQSPSQVRIES